VRAGEGRVAADVPGPAGRHPVPRTFGRIFARLDPVEFPRRFLAWVGAMVPDTVGQVVALRGKTLRRSHDRANGKAAPHMVSAWACGSGLVRGPLAVDDTSNALTALPALLRLLALDGATVTIDALGCQTAIAAQIVAQGAEYALALKDNHPTLHAEVAEVFADARATTFAAYAPADHDAWRTTEKDHGRIETRRFWTSSDPAIRTYLNQGDAWAGLRAIGLAERERRVGTTVTVETRHYLLSGAGGAAAFGHAARRHWGIEIVQTQMTKTGVLPTRASRDDVANLDLVVGHHHAVDEQFDELSPLDEGGACEARLDPVAKLLSPLHLGRHIHMACRLGFQVLVLLRQALVLLRHLAAPSLILGERHHPAQIRLGQPLQLLVEAHLSSA